MMKNIARALIIAAFLLSQTEQSLAVVDPQLNRPQNNYLGNLKAVIAAGAYVGSLFIPEAASVNPFIVIDSASETDQARKNFEKCLAQGQLSHNNSSYYTRDLQERRISDYSCKLGPDEHFVAQLFVTDRPLSSTGKRTFAHTHNAGGTSALRDRKTNSASEARYAYELAEIESKRRKAENKLKDKVTVS